MARLPLVIGLTGSIGMGKTETAKLFAELGIPVFDSDSAVHRIYDIGGAAVPLIEKNFPDTVSDGRVDRAALRARVSSDKSALDRLNALIHPLIFAERDAFLKRSERAGAEMVVLDTPLLFETDAHRQVDVIVVASAPHEVQRRRVLSRPGMTRALLDSILAKQVPDEEKRAQAHFVVVTDKGRDHARDQVEMIVAALKDRLRANRNA